MACVATTRRGTPCQNSSSFFEGHCGIHHNSLYASDPAYRQRYTTYINAIPERRREEDERRAARLAAEAAAAAEQQRVRDEQIRQEAEQRREAIRTRNQQALDTATQSTPTQIVNYARTLGNLWLTIPLEGYDVIRAYIALRHRSSKHAGFDTLIRAAVTLINQTMHAEYTNYRDVPLAERQAALTALTAALVPYGEIRLEEIPQRDVIYASVQVRIRRDAEIEAQRANAIRREAERAQLQADLRERPVVFRRDPDRSIDLRQFGRDNENVHRSSVQDTTHKAVLMLLERPIREGQETLSEVVAAFNESRIVRFTSLQTRDRAIAEITHDYFETEAFSTKYGDVLDRVWAYINPHEERVELIIRLAQEVCDGIRTCSNGKMARLVNVLRGFDDSLDFDIPRQYFQAKFATLINIPVGRREAAANEIFEECNIPAEERNVWLTPLMEA